MLQQTQVETVIPYYIKWIDRFPSIQHVASSKSDSILKYWEGLGYYQRCINFHKSCQIIVSERNGEFPNELEEFLKLPELEFIQHQLYYQFHTIIQYP